MENKFLTLITQTGAFLQLKNDFLKGIGAHAYLIECADSEFLKEFLRVSAAIVICKDCGCLKCENCKKALDANHADIISYPVNRTNIVVDDIADLVKQAYIKPVEGDHKIFILAEGDNMSEYCQNKLLKILEEPPENVVIFIGITSTSNVLNTIKSRCQLVSVERLADKKIFDYLINLGVKNEVASVVSESSFGNVSNAIKMIYDDNYIKIYDAVTKMLAGMISTKDALPHISKLISYKPYSDDMFTAMLLVFRQAMVYSINKNKLLSNEIKDDIITISNLYSLQAILKCIELINIARLKANMSCNFIVVIDQLVLSILEVKFLCQ